MTADSSSAASEAHRLLAYIYFTCADSDADWQNEETFALYELLERHAGGLARAQSVALAQEAYQRWQDHADQDARVRHIEAHAHDLGHLSHDQRDRYLDDIRGLLRVDGKVSGAEEALYVRLRDILRAVPHHHHHHHDHDHHRGSPRDTEVRLLAFIYFTFADADGNWQNEETIALYDALERHTGAGAREHTIALAQQAYGVFQTVPAGGRIAWLAERVPTALTHRDIATRKQILIDLIGQGRSDGEFSPAEKRTFEELRAVLLGA